MQWNTMASHVDMRHFVHNEVGCKDEIDTNKQVKREKKKRWYTSLEAAKRAWTLIYPFTVGYQREELGFLFRCVQNLKNYIALHVVFHHDRFL